MNDQDRGYYGKFRVERTDRRSAPGQKHDGCEYFVLDLTHDPYAMAALRVYAASCRLTHPHLAADLQRMVEAAPPPAADLIVVDRHRLEKALSTAWEVGFDSMPATTGEILSSLTAPEE